MRRQGEVDVEPEKDDPWIAVAIRGGRRTVEHVEVEGVWDVGEHGEKVSHSEGRQKIAGRVDELFTSEDGYVKEVAEDADDADDEANVAVEVCVPFGKAFQVIHRFGSCSSC